MLYSSTVLARNASSILAHISRLPAELASHPLLFTLSANAPASSLSSLVSALSSFSSSGSVGCLSAPLSQLATATSTDATTTTGPFPIACSLAFFRKDHAVPFRSDIPGRPETQVGRWHAMRKKGYEEKGQGGEVGLAEEDVNWETIWNRSLRGNELPPALRGIQKQDVHTIITLTDNAPQGLNDSLSSFSSATKLGLVCSSTPFVTGRPYTLVYNGTVHSSGAVGIALSAGPRPGLQTAYPGLRAITPPLKVTASEGNLVHELNNQNPVALLVSAITESMLSDKAAKDDEFYLGILRDGNELSQVHHIMSGGPSRGTMALETETAPREGTSVQLFHRPRHAPTSSSDLLHAAKNSLMFVAEPQADSAPADERGDAVTLLDDVFVAASENGFMLSQENETPWTCVCPGARAQVTW